MLFLQLRLDLTYFFISDLNRRVKYPTKTFPLMGSSNSKLALKIADVRALHWKWKTMLWTISFYQNGLGLHYAREPIDQHCRVCWASLCSAARIVWVAPDKSLFRLFSLPIFSESWGFRCGEVTLKWFHYRPTMWQIHLFRGSPIGNPLFTFASKAKISEGI